MIRSSRCYWISFLFASKLASESIGGPIRTCCDHDWLRGGVVMVLFYLVRTRYALDHKSTVKKITSEGEHNKEKGKKIR